MTSNTTATGAGNGEAPMTTAVRMANLTRALIFLFVFMLGIKGLGDGFGLLGADLLEGFFLVTENPFLALMVGILTTSMVQSSSVTTALIPEKAVAWMCSTPKGGTISKLSG